MFSRGIALSGGGKIMSWFIDTLDLKQHDWATIAHEASKTLKPFGEVVAIKGGQPLKEELDDYVTKGSDRVLYVSDVWVTGKTFMQAVRADNRPWEGFVAFSRGTLPNYIKTFMQVPL
jgi:hypothetical protein